MKSGGMDFGKVALVFGMAAFQLHILTMTTSEFLIVGQWSNRSNHRNNVIQAFIIIAYLLYILGLLLLLVLSYSNLRGSKGLSAFTALVQFIAASSVVIGLAVFDAETYRTPNTSTNFPPYSRDFSSYTTTTYVTAAATGYASCIVLLVSLCL